MCLGCDGPVLPLTDPERRVLQDFVRIVTSCPDSPFHKDSDRAEVAWQAARTRVGVFNHNKHFGTIRYFEPEEKAMRTRAEQETQRRDRALRKATLKKLLKDHGYFFRNPALDSTWILKYSGIPGYKTMLDEQDARFEQGYTIEVDGRMFRLK
jgi:predicted ABC-class ATPase